MQRKWEKALRVDEDRGAPARGGSDAGPASMGVSIAKTGVHSTSSPRDPFES